MGRGYATDRTLQSAAEATANGESLPVVGLATVAFQVTGTFTATVTFEATIDGSNWVSIRARNVATGVVATTATAAGVYVASCSGFSLVRARVTWTSGTSVTVTSIGVGSPPSYPFAAEDFGLGLANVLVPGSIKGKKVYVDTAANGAVDTNDGLSRGTPKLTISGALDVCTNMMYDTIVLLNYTAASEIEWPIAVDVQAVRIVSSPTGGWMPRYDTIRAVGDYACMTIDANFVHLENLEFAAGASHAGVEFDTSGVLRPGIYDCLFGTGKYGVWTTGTGKPSVGLTVQGCHFVNALTSYGLYNQSDGPFYLFKDNTFDQLPSTGIYCQKGVAGRIISNRFALASGYSAGAAITIEGTNAQRCIIDDNRAGYGKDADGVGNANPYKDTCSQGTNHWFLNYKGITATEPATS